MAAYGYLIFLLRASVSHRPVELYRTNAVGQAGLDLLDVFDDRVDGLGHGYHPIDRTAEGFRVKETQRAGRTLWMKINRGPGEGQPGETYDLDTDQSTETTERQALLSGLRAMFFLPRDSYYGLLFVERVGRRHLRDLLNDFVIRPSSSVVGSTLRVESFAEISDWQRELAPLSVLRVSEMLVKSESGADPSTVDDTLVTISAEGGQLHKLSSGMKNLFASRIRRRDAQMEALSRSSELGERRRTAERDGVAFQDEEEYKQARDAVQALNVASDHPDGLTAALDRVVPVDRSNYDHQRYEFALGEKRVERNIIVERDTIPQFIYEMKGRPYDGGLRNTWTQHAATILSNQGVQLPAGGDLRNVADGDGQGGTTTP